MHSQFTLQDLWGISLAILAFGVLLVPSGFLVGWATNVLGFRRASLTEQSLLSIVLSIAVFPIITNLLGRWIPLHWLAVLDLVLVLPSLVLLLRGKFPFYRGASWDLSRPKRLLLWLAFAWVVLSLLSLSDMQLGTRLYTSVASDDHGVRAELVGSAIRRGVPIVNPFYYVDGPTTVRYFYYWYSVCAIPASLFGLLPRYVLFASSIWTGFALAAIISLYLKHFFHETQALHQRCLLGIALLAVSGLDLLPISLLYLAKRIVLPEMEWWDSDQVTSWIDALLWVPHHVAAMVACLTGLLVLVTSSDDPDRRTQIGAITVAALALASGGGMSVYVAMVFALFLPVWILRLVFKRRPLRALPYIAAGIGAILISVLYLRELARGGGSAATNASFVLGLRGQPIALHGLRNLVAAFFKMLCIYGIEFGFFGIVAAIQLWRDLTNRKTLSEREIACWYLAGCSLLVATFVRSTVITNNDLGYRSIMFAQFIFLLWGARILDSRLNDHRARKTVPPFGTELLNFALCITLSLGALAAFYQVIMLRLYPVLADHGRVPARQAPGADNFLIRSAYQALASHIPAQSIVQPNPDSPVARDLLLYSNHQTVDAGAPNCGTTFGGSLLRCQQIQEEIRHLFQSPLADWRDADALCTSLSINVLLVTRDDAVWQNPDSWVWRRNPIVANSFVRTFACGKS